MITFLGHRVQLHAFKYMLKQNINNSFYYKAMGICIHRPPTSLESYSLKFHKLFSQNNALSHKLKFHALNLQNDYCSVSMTTTLHIFKAY